MLATCKYFVIDFLFRFLSRVSRSILFGNIFPAENIETPNTLSPSLPHSGRCILTRRFCSLEGVELWLGSRLLLKERILPMGERAALTKQDNSGFSTRLEEKVVGELLGIRDVLTELIGGGA